MAQFAFALEQDPRIIVHVGKGTSSTNQYQLTISNPSEAPDFLRRRCVAALGLSPLSFDPPTNLVQFAIPREGAQWQPAAR